MKILLAGYMIPGIGHRAYSVRMIDNDEELDAEMTRAINYVEGRGFLCPVFDVLDFNEYKKDPLAHIEKLKQRVLEAYIQEYPEELVPEIQIEDDSIF